MRYVIEKRSPFPFERIPLLSRVDLFFLPINLFNEVDFFKGLLSGRRISLPVSGTRVRSSRSLTDFPVRFYNYSVFIAYALKISVLLGNRFIKLEYRR